MTPDEPLAFRSILLDQATQAAQLFNATGEGVVWAVVASGIDGGHPHFRKWRNLDVQPPLRHFDFGSLDVEAPLTDNFGNGTAVAAAIAGESEQGWLVRKIEGEWETVRLAGVKGLAPKCKLVSMKVLDDQGSGRASTAIQALSAVQDLNRTAGALKIHGVCLGLHYEYDPEMYGCGQSPICQMVNELVRSGVVVIAAAGNFGFGRQVGMYEQRLGGIPCSITDPGNAELAITVGSCHSLQPEQFGVSYFSGKGPTLDGRDKPELVVPGERVVTAGGPAGWKPGGGGIPDGAAVYTETSGTSIAAAIASGAVAALLSGRPEFIGKPDLLKRRLVETARDLGRRREYQGHGLLDLLKAAQPDNREVPAQLPRREALRVVISYSHRDEELMNVLRSQLRGLELRGLIEVWHDRDLRAGDEWSPEIAEHLESADITILLLSADFVASENCYEKELPIAMRRHSRGRTRIVPVLLRPFDLEVLPLAALNAVPKNRVAITEWTNQDKAWTEVAQQVRRVVESITGASADATRLVPST